MLPHATLVLCLLTLASALSSAAEGPCDLLGTAGNPCVAAHSTVRALYATYVGHLYQVARPDNSTTDIGVLEAGGFADIAAHEKFCAAGDCVIKTIYDQSPQGNHLVQRISCVATQGCETHKMVNASKHKIAVRGGVNVYGMWFDPGYGYHVDNTTGVPKGNDPESIYAVMSGKRFNEHCCFDYGNSENTITATKEDYGCGSMEAIYFGNSNWVPHAPWTAPDGNRGHGSGPWVGADLEAGMYYGGGNQTRVNEQNTPLTSEFVSLSLKGRTDGFTLKGGDATQGSLKTMYDGPRPDEKIAGDCGGAATKNHYQPMRKQGAIVLATGGDNSNGAEGNFYEGFMASGYASSATDEKIQANIIAVGYKAYQTTPWK